MQTIYNRKNKQRNTKYRAQNTNTDDSMHVQN